MNKQIFSLPCKQGHFFIIYESSMRKLLETQTIQKMKRRRERSSARIIIFWLAQSFLVRMRRRNFRRVQRLTRFLKISPKKEFYQKMWSEKNVYKIALHLVNLLNLKGLRSHGTIFMTWWSAVFVVLLAASNKHQLFIWPAAESCCFDRRVSWLQRSGQIGVHSMKDRY